jgi:hypothetical protein
VKDLTIQLVLGEGFPRQYRLRLVAANGEVLAVSEAYYSKANARRAARKNFAGIPLREVAK